MHDFYGDTNSALNLNTSYVKVQLKWLKERYENYTNLNTSYVKVQSMQ